METLAHHQLAGAQIIRDRRGLTLARIERQAFGKLVARDARGLVVATFDLREGMTRDSRRLIVARTIYWRRCGPVDDPQHIQGVGYDVCSVSFKHDHRGRR